MNFSKLFRVSDTHDFKLKKVDPADCAGIDKKDAEVRLASLKEKLSDLQYRLYAENRQSLLIVLQALDAAGKDGVINQVLSVMNPQGCGVRSFKVPTPVEAAHDFLWRAHIFTPKNGEIMIFNRSYYESVLVEKVHHFASDEEIEARYGFINDFERMLAFHHTRIVKIFLHISPEEQLTRFLKRLVDPAKNWKISDSDYRERALWDDYTAAFERTIETCSSDAAPWFVIPSNKKWFRNLAVAGIVAETLSDMAPKIPDPKVDLAEIRRLALAEAEKAGSLSEYEKIMHQA